MSFVINPLHAIDSYKLAHREAYPEGTSEIYSNFTPRSVRHLNVPKEFKNNEIVWFGGQATITDLIEEWDELFFERDIEEVIDEYKARVVPFAGEDYAVDHIRRLHAIGYLPLEIKTLDEGIRIPVNVPVMTIRNTNPEFFWLTNYLETDLSAELWKISTSATIADYYRKILESWADKTGGNKDFIDFQAHDFSHRGMSGSLDAAKSGAGHLASFKGTDNIVSVDYLAYHYAGDETFVGASVPATEHSVATAYGQDEREYLRRVVTEVYPNGIVSVVADSYDFFGFVTNHVASLKDEILARGTDAMGFSKVVIRPDSGDPVRIICGDDIQDYTDKVSSVNELTEYVVDDLVDNVRCETPHGECGESYPNTIAKFDGKFYKITAYIEWNRYDKEYYYVDGSGLESVIEIDITPEQKGAIELLWDIFGGTVNDKGFKTLNQKIGLIYGDSITLSRADEILRRLAEKGFASDNVVFGVGSASYQGGLG